MPTPVYKSFRRDTSTLWRKRYNINSLVLLVEMRNVGSIVNLLSTQLTLCFAYRGVILIHQTEPSDHNQLMSRYKLVSILQI